MRNTRFHFLLTLLLLAAFPTHGAAAQGELDGQIILGYRTVDVDGAERKFFEDVHQEDGPILFQLDLDQAFGKENALADEIEFTARDLGSGAFETLHFEIRKYDSYRFKLDRRQSEYFYEDIILPPELANIRSSSGGDFHHFDFERVQTQAELELQLSKAAKLTFGFDHFTRRGEGTTTLDISRDEFEVDRPIDEESQTSTLGFSYAWEKVSLVLEERLREFDNTVELFLPGFSEGESPGPATLDFYFFNQPYDYTTHEHAVRVLARPNDKVDLRFSAEVHDLSLELAAEERSQGLAFNGSPLAVDQAGDGDIERDLALYDFDVTYLLSDRVGLEGSVRRYGLDQDGESALGNAENLSHWEIDSTAWQAGVVFFLDSHLSVGVGLSLEERDVQFTQLEDGEGVSEDATTESDGYYFNTLWRPGTGLELSGKVEVNSIDAPLTLATPTDRERYSARARYRWPNGCWFSGVYQLQDFANDESGWAAKTEKTAVRFGYRDKDLNVSVGYSMIDLERQIDSLVNEVLLFDDLYLADSEFLDLTARWRANERLTLGGMARLYDNGGSFALKRDEYRAFIEIAVGERYLLGLAYRQIDYEEEVFDFDNYSADIVDLSIGYRF